MEVVRSHQRYAQAHIHQFPHDYITPLLSVIGVARTEDGLQLCVNMRSQRIGHFSTVTNLQPNLAGVWMTDMEIIAGIESLALKIISMHWYTVNHSRVFKQAVQVMLNSD